MALIQVSGVRAGVLRVISYAILTYSRTFSSREPIPFPKWIFGPYAFNFEEGPHHIPKAHALSYMHSKVGNDRMHIRGERTSGK